MPQQQDQNAGKRGMQTAAVGTTTCESASYVSCFTAAAAAAAVVVGMPSSHALLKDCFTHTLPLVL
jgi:hypothetical protein